MLRVSDETRERVQRIASEEMGGATVDEVIRRLLDEHWEARAVAAVEEYRANDPEGWEDYLAETAEWSTVDTPVRDPE